MTQNRFLGVLSVLALAAPAPRAMAGDVEKVAGAVVQLPTDDFSAEGLRHVQQAVLARWQCDYYHLPLDVKAEYYEWELWRYHLTPWRQIHHYTMLPENRGEAPGWIPGNDSSTWNGALLAALSHKYAVTRDPRTLQRIATLLEGMRFFFEVTGKRGLAARCVGLPDAARTPDHPTPYTAPDGTRYLFRGDPAKGGYNQIAGGLAAVMMYVHPDLPPESQQLAQRLVTDLVTHVVDHDYHLTKADGQRTPYGNLTPRVGHLGIPFNAQVAYEIVALGHVFPPADPAERARVEHQFRRLREEHHVYYAHPWQLVQPQRVGASPLVKGMNDRMHVTTAAFTGLELERFQAKRDGRPLDTVFVYRLGATVNYSLSYLRNRGNSLCNFMWAALLTDPEVFEAMIHRKENTRRHEMEQALAQGVEQLRRFNLDRFLYPGHPVETGRLQWADRRRSNDYQWKEPADVAWQITGPPTNEATCGTDYLYAYWLLRHYALDTHPCLKPHEAVLRRNPGMP